MEGRITLGIYDEDCSRKDMFHNRFENFGYSVDFAFSCPKGFDRQMFRSIKLLIYNIVEQESNHLTNLKKIREWSNDLPIIIYTASTIKPEYHNQLLYEGAALIIHNKSFQTVFNEVEKRVTVKDNRRERSVNEKLKGTSFEFLIGHESKYLFLKELCNGLSVKDAGRKRGLTYNTAKTYNREMQEDCGFGNLHEMVSKAGFEKIFI